MTIDLCGVSLKFSPKNTERLRVMIKATVAAIFALTASSASAATPPPASSPATAPADTASVPDTVRVTVNVKGRDVRAPVAFEPSDKGIIQFKMTVAGREVWAIIDSGAERSLIDVEFARAAGLTLTRRGGNVQTPGGGSMEAWNVFDVPLDVPGQLDLRAPLVAIDMKALSALAGREIDFILGENFLKIFALVVDPGRRTFQFGPSGATTLPANFPMVPIGDGEAIEVLVGDKPVRVRIDTGSTRALTLTPQAWARVGPKDAEILLSSSTGADGQSAMVDVAQGQTVKIGPHMRPNVEVQIAPWPAKDSDGVIGMGLLRDMFFILDLSAKKLWIMPRQSSRVGG